MSVLSSDVDVKCEHIPLVGSTDASLSYMQVNFCSPRMDNLLVKVIVCKFNFCRTIP